MRYVTDANGKLVGTQDYSAYGATVRRSGETGQLGYAGMWQHETSGLNLTWYRPYNPRTGRWLSRDPIGEEGGLNLFGYVDGGPVNARDTTGLAPVAYYIKKWLCDPRNMDHIHWDSAFPRAREEKMGPNFDPTDPDDNHNRTAAEHYIFFRSILAGDHGVITQAVFGVFGSYAAVFWQGSKAAGWSPRSSHPSMIQAHWEFAAYADGIGLTKNFDGGPGKCGCESRK